MARETLTLLGRSLEEVVACLKGEPLDVEIELTYRKRRYAGRRHKGSLSARLVGLHNPTTVEPLPHQYPR